MLLLYCNRHQKQEFAMKVVQKISMGLENQKSSANVEVLVQQLFTSITVHVHIGQLLGAYFAKEIARTISDDISCKQRFLALKE